jgi:hypothetical protein
MKKILLPVVLLFSAGAFAQKAQNHIAEEIKNTLSIATGNIGAKATAVGDTVTFSHIGAADTGRILYSAGANSGYLTGTNIWGDKAFAERYDISGADSSVKVIGVFAQFGGSVSASSGKTISLKIWGAGVPQMVTADMYYNGFPHKVSDSLVVPVTQLGIGPVKDTLKKFALVSAAPLSASFFVGYSVNYNFSTLAGDTIALATSMDGNRTSPKYMLSYTTDATGDTVDVDTMVNVQNATLWSDNTWHDNYTENDSLFNNLAIFPIVIIGNPTEVRGITRNGLTFYGSYPNPATHTANIQFSLTESADVAVQVLDAGGRIANTATRPNAAAGAHVLPVSTAAMVSGTYYYIVRTSHGDGVAGVLVVAK